ncbi:MAG: hypothetical protein KGH63_00340 [Candidatus Micrarchaeota archaeon]|nr:hypothetical protein [Candidatus Micrarchaeota archaeon]
MTKKKRGGPAPEMVLLALFLVLPLLAGGLFATAPVNGTPASIELDSPGDGYSSQSKSVTFNFVYHKNDDIYSNPYCALLVNGTNINASHFAAESAASFTYYAPYRAKYNWQIACEDTLSDVRSFTILPLDPPTLSLAAPRDQSSAVGPVVDFYFDYNSGSDELDSTNCTLIVGPLIQSSGPAISGSRAMLESGPLHPALYSWFVRCDRPGGNDPLETKPWLITVTAPPEVPNVTNLTNVTPNATAPASTFANEQVLIDAPAYAPAGMPVRLVVNSLDQKPVVGAVVDVYLAEGGRIALPPTDAYGQAAFTPNTTGVYSYSVENLLLVQPASTNVTSSGAAENASGSPPSGASAGSTSAPAGTPSGGPGQNGGSPPKPAPVGGNNAAGAGAGANATSSVLPVPPDGIPLWMLAAGAGAVALAAAAFHFAFRKPKDEI